MALGKKKRIFDAKTLRINIGVKSNGGKVVHIVLKKKDGKILFVPIKAKEWHRLVEELEGAAIALRRRFGTGSEVPVEDFPTLRAFAGFPSE